MHLKMIACEVFYREVCYNVALSPHTVDIAFTKKGAHDNSDVLRQEIQQRIDQTEQGEETYDAILLGYGLCGNGAADLVVRQTKLVIPRAHDCCTIFLGSKSKFQEHFGSNPSLPFSSAGYMERGDSYMRESTMDKTLGLDKSFEEYVQMYGEENARYIMQTLHPEMNWEKDDRLVFIDIPEFGHLGYRERCEARAQEEGKRFVHLPGDMRLIKDLVYGNWPPEEFLIVQPGHRIRGVYDWDEIICSVSADE